MRFFNSPEWAKARDAAVAAYKVWQKADEASDYGSPEEREASEAEYAALNLMMAEPAQTVGDLAGKLEIYIEREMFNWNGDREPGAASRYLAQLRADMTRLAQPNVSTAMAAAFTVWAEARAGLEAAEYVEGATGEELDPEATHAETVAFLALMALPCITPGDFMVKAYIELLDSEGAYNGGYPFQIRTSIGGEKRDEVAKHAMLRDLADSDLGRCMMALGRIDFEAEAWIAEMDALGHDFTLMIDGDKRTFWQSVGDPDGLTAAEAERHRMLTYLLGGETWRERTTAVCAAIEANHPARIQRVPAKQEEAA